MANVIDLFSGVGGLSNGFKKAGFDILLANEIDEQIAYSYTKNNPETLMINMDIKKFVLDFDNIIASKLENINDIKRKKQIKNGLKNVDVIIGGPPCQGFSMAGARIRKKNGFIDDPRNFLFKYYFKVLQKFEPKYFVFENVQGLITMDNGDILKQIITIFSDDSNFKNGAYKIDTLLIDSSKLGIPQKRKRLIILGRKKDNIHLKERLKDYIDLNKIKTVTVRDAISDLAYLNSGEGSYEQNYKFDPNTDYQRELRKNARKLYNHVAFNHSEKVMRRIKEVKSGENFKSLSDSKKIRSVHSGSHGRLEWDNPSYTITTRFDTPSAGRVIHPQLNRTITPREAARLQSFDDTFKFYGSKTSICKQIGNAVPPKLAFAIATIIKNDLRN